MISPKYYISKEWICIISQACAFLEKGIGILYLAHSGKSTLFLQKSNHKHDYKLKKNNPWFGGDINLMVCPFRQKLYVLSDKNGNINSMFSASELG